MKKFKSLYIILAALFVVSACKIDDAEPIPVSEINYGALLRTIEIPGGTFNLFDFAGSEFTVVLEADDIQGGGLLESVDVNVAHRRGATVSPEAFVRNIPASAFAPGGDRNLPRTTVSVNGAEALQLLNMTADMIEGGDFIEFRMTLNLTDGRSFTNTNPNGDVAGGAFFRSPFLYRAPVVCPSSLGGTYRFEMAVLNSPYGACDGTAGEVTFTPVENLPGSYLVSDASFGLFECIGDSWGNGDIRLNDACGALSFSGADKYSASYEFSFISNNGSELVFEWVNTFDEQGRVTLFAPAGFTFPNELQ